MAAVKKVRIDLDRANVLAVGVSLAAPHVAETTRAVRNRAMVLAPKKTGNLANAHQMTMRARRTYVAGTVENRVKYFMPVHDGSDPYTIRAKRKRALVFYWKRVGMVTVVPKNPRTRYTGVMKSKRKGVRFHIGKGYVDHPRMKGRPFLMRALEEVATARGYKVIPSGRAAATGDF
jgi:hypothetical protein